MQRTLYLPVLVLAISAHAQQAYPDHVIQNVDWSSGTHHTAVTLPIVAPAVPALPTSVTATADAEFVSGTSVRLLPGFHAGAFTGAGRFRAHIGEGLGQSADVVLVAPDTAMPVVDHVVHVPKWEKLEIGLKLPNAYKAAIDSFFTHYYPNGTTTAATPGAVDPVHDLNPYADDSLQLFMTLTKPSGEQTMKWGFYMYEAAWSDSSDTALLIGDTTNVFDLFRVRFRFAPDEEGPWQFAVTVKAPHTHTAMGSTLPPIESTGFSFVCDPPLPDNKGRLSVNDANHRTLKFETGEPFFGLGTNMADIHRRDAPGFGEDLHQRDFNVMRQTMEQLHEMGGNYLRMFLMRNLFAPEWVNLGVYDQFIVPVVCDLSESLNDPNCDRGWSTGHKGNCQYQCWAFDKMVEHARANNIYIQLCIDPYGPGIAFEKLLWGPHPYVINYLDPQPTRPFDVKEFFYTNGDPDSTDSGVFYFWKRRYKYIMSRWGYSVNVPIIEPTNEVDQMLTYRERNFGVNAPVAVCDGAHLDLVDSRDVCLENRVNWPLDTNLPGTISSWLTDITDFVRGDVTINDPVYSPLGEQKLFLMSYAGEGDTTNTNYYLPFSNPKVDLIDVHQGLYEAPWGLIYGAQRSLGFRNHHMSLGNKKPFHQGEFNYYADKVYPDGRSRDTGKLFANYDVSFHNELWASTFYGNFAAGTTWGWERVFWWPDALPKQNPDLPNDLGNLFDQVHSGVLDSTNILWIGSGIAVPVKNKRLHHHFKPLSDLLNRPNWLALDFFNGDFSPHRVYDDVHNLECYYLLRESSEPDQNHNLAIGWVHNLNAFWDNSYYITKALNQFVDCTTPSAQSLALPGFATNSNYYISWFPTHLNDTICPADTLDEHQNGTVTLHMDNPPSAALNGILNNHLDTLHSDYAFIIATTHVKSLHPNEASEVATSTTGWDFDVFPNPAREEVTIRLPDDGPTEIVLFDLMGRRISSWSTFTGTLLRLPLNDLAKGMYWVQASDGKHRKAKKLMVY